MAEILVLARRHLQGALRSRAARVAALIYLAAVLVAIWGPRSATAAGGTLVLFALVALTLLVYAVASGVGNGLPDDRRSGRLEWLRTTAPPAWKHRAALVVAGWTLALLAGLFGGVVAGLAATVAAPEFDLHRSSAVPLPGGTALLVRRPPDGASEGPPLTVVLPGPVPADGQVELELRPQFESARVLVDFAELDWRSDTGGSGAVHASVWRALRLQVPAGTREITLVNRTPHVGVRIRRARMLSPAAAPVFLLIAGAGLLLGFMAGAAAPVGVVISRFTSGTTASIAAFLVLLYGSLAQSLLGLLQGFDVEGFVRVARTLLLTLGWFAPHLPTAELIGEYASGRTFGVAAATWLPQLLVHTAVLTLLAAVPLPRAWTDRKLVQ